MSIILIVIRIYICYKFVGGLIMNMVNPKDFPIENLNWLLYYLVFDIWIQIVVPTPSEEPEE